MKICIFYTSPKLGDLVLQLPFIKAIAKKYKTKVTISINKHIAIKNLLEKQGYIDYVIENSYRRGKYFIIDLFVLSQELKKFNFDLAFILEKTKGPAIASKLAGIKKIYAFGIGSQKYLVDSHFNLKKNDLRYNFTKQSIKFLNILKVSNNFNGKFLTLNNRVENEIYKKYLNLPKPWVCFGVDSTEINRVWPQKNFAELADKLIEKNLAKTIFVINHENQKNYFHEIIKNSKYQNQFVNCKSLNRSEIIYLIDVCEYFVGIDSGPSCVAGALDKKTFCIIGPTDKTLLRFSSMKKIISDIYDRNREVGIKRCGDNFVQNDSEVKRISVSKVFDTIVKNL
jgi:ADP-heptose:LPS heptosyltransferase